MMKMQERQKQTSTCVIWPVSIKPTSLIIPGGGVCQLTPPPTFSYIIQISAESRAWNSSAIIPQWFKAVIRQPKEGCWLLGWWHTCCNLVFIFTRTSCIILLQIKSSYLYTGMWLDGCQALAGAGPSFHCLLLWTPALLFRAHKHAHILCPLTGQCCPSKYFTQSDDWIWDFCQVTNMWWTFSPISSVGPVPNGDPVSSFFDGIRRLWCTDMHKNIKA